MEDGNYFAAMKTLTIIVFILIIACLGIRFRGGVAYRVCDDYILIMERGGCGVSISKRGIQFFDMRKLKL